MCNSIQKHHVFKILVIFFLCLLLFIPGHGQTNTDEKISRDLLQADLFQLVNLLETVHPDPYINGGGKIAFHRRFYKLLKKIPPTGMNRDEFFRFIRPFVVAVEDSHTSVGLNLGTDKYTGGIPLFFSIIEQSLYVYGAPKPYKDLLGARLLSVEGISWDELVKRASVMVSHESDLQLLMFLSRELIRHEI